MSDFPNETCSRSVSRKSEEFYSVCFVLFTTNLKISVSLNMFFGISNHLEKLGRLHGRRVTLIMSPHFPS